MVTPLDITRSVHAAYGERRRRAPATTVRPARYRWTVPTVLRSLPRPAAVLFDLDGTLVDTVATRIRSWIEGLESAGFPTTEEDVAPLIGIDGRRLAIEVAARRGVSLAPERAEAIDRDTGERYERLNRQPRPLPGVRELVAALDGAGVPWAIATSSRAEQVATSVAALSLPREPRIVDAGDVQHAKPEPDLLLHAAAQLGVPPTRCWYVGDSTWDMVAAVAAGMIAIGVTRGAAVGAPVLREAGAAAVVETLEELVDVVASSMAAGPEQGTA